MFYCKAEPKIQGQTGSKPILVRPMRKLQNIHKVHIERGVHMDKQKLLDALAKAAEQRDETIGRCIEELRLAEAESNKHYEVFLEMTARAAAYIACNAKQDARYVSLTRAAAFFYRLYMEAEDGITQASKRISYASRR